MTETTEEKVKRIVMNQEGLKILDIIKGDFHDCISELAGHGVSTTTIATLVNAHTSLTEEIQVTKAQVSSLTKERDELKFKAKDHSHKVSTLIKIKYELQEKLSNRDKEIEELKKKNESLENALKVTPGVITEQEGGK